MESKIYKIPTHKDGKSDWGRNIIGKNKAFSKRTKFMRPRHPLNKTLTTAPNTLTENDTRAQQSTCNRLNTQWQFVFISLSSWVLIKFKWYLNISTAQLQDAETKSSR